MIVRSLSNFYGNFQFILCLRSMLTKMYINLRIFTTQNIDLIMILIVHGFTNRRERIKEISIDTIHFLQIILTIHIRDFFNASPLK